MVIGKLYFQPLAKKRIRDRGPEGEDEDLLHAHHVVHVGIHVVVVVVVVVVVIIVVVVIVDGRDKVNNGIKEGHGKGQEGQLGVGVALHQGRQRRR